MNRFWVSILGVRVSAWRSLMSCTCSASARDHSTNEQPAARVAEIVRDKKVDHVVAGIPRQMNGQIGTAATEVLDFVEELRAILPCPIVTWDERLTTVAAHRALRDAGKKTRHTRGYVDQVAAQMILQSYLDSLAQKAAGGL